MKTVCPQCHSEAAIEGKVYNQIDYVNPPAYFRPNSLPFYAILTTNIKLQNSFFACPVCGFFWSKINNQDLQRSVVNKVAV